MGLSAAKGLGNNLKGSSPLKLAKKMGEQLLKQLKEQHPEVAGFLKQNPQLEQYLKQHPELLQSVMNSNNPMQSLQALNDLVGQQKAQPAAGAGGPQGGGGGAPQASGAGGGSPAGGAGGGESLSPMELLMKLLAEDPQKAKELMDQMEQNGTLTPGIKNFLMSAAGGGGASMTPSAGGASIGIT